MTGRSIHLLKREFRQKVDVILESRWPLVEALGHALLADTVLNRDDIDRLVAEVAKNAA